MENAQKEAYADSLEKYQSIIWGSKLWISSSRECHLQLPLHICYLFSLGIYAQAVKEGKGYEKKYMANA